ncbi:MAG TPA: hypothetical protein VN325_35450 [Steroidobacteraceae bacterium]|nr:hypothetical protein [Steroidobacteraceae bacterium]
MTTNTTTLRINGYGADSGRIVCYRQPDYRFAHEQLGVIQITAPKDFAAKVVAALDYDPACLVGIGRDHTVVLFRTAKRNVYAKHEFIFDGKQGSLLATVEGPPVDVSAYTWAGGRSPLSVARNALPPMFEDHIASMLAAVTEFGGKLGTLPTAADLERDRKNNERLEKLREEIAAGHWTPEAIEAREDEKLAASMPLDISMSDGILAQNVIGARKRIAMRKRQAAAA